MRHAANLLLISSLAAAAPGGEPVRLTGPRVLKLDWATRGLCAGDLDGDQRADLALVNNDRAQIDLLYQRTPEEIRAAAPRKLGSPRWEPVIEDAPFLRESVMTGDFMYDLELLDVDADGRLDLVYTGKRDRIAARLQDDHGDFEEEWSYDKEEPSANVGSLAAADVDRDGRRDLVALTNAAILIFRVVPGEHTFPTPVTYRVSEENPQQLRVTDLDGDGRVDLAYVAEGAARAIRVRYQQEDGGFGPEVGLPIQVGAADWCVLGAGPSGHLVTIKRTRSELLFTPLADPWSGGAQRRALDIRSQPVQKSGVNASIFGVGDFDGDGRGDVAVADPDGSAIHLYTQDEGGEFRRPREFPAPQGISSLSALARKGQPDALLVCSEKEGMVGIAEMQDGRLTFPRSIAVPGTPLVATAHDLDQDGKAELVVAAKDGLRFSLELLKEKDGAFVAAEVVKLGSIKRSPAALHAGDLDGDGDADLAVFIPREPARLLRQTGALKFEEIGEEDSVRTSQFEGVLPERFAVGDFTGDGKAEMLVAGKGFIRAYRVGKDGLEIVDQANGRASLDELSGPVLVDVDQDGRDELLAYHASDGAFQVLKRDEAGLFRYAHSLDTGPIALVQAEVRDLGGNAGRRLLVFGKDRFWSVPVQDAGRAGEAERSSYRTDLKDVKYTGLALGDLNHDGVAEVLAVDAASHVLDVLTGDPGSGLRSTMFFKVYEENRFVSAERRAPLQPRELLVADLTGDGRDDVVLLCHDRVLLYPQGALEATGQ